MTTTDGFISGKSLPEQTNNHILISVYKKTGSGLFFFVYRMQYQAFPAFIKKKIFGKR